MKIKREQMLKEINAVMPGLSQREIIEQSSCVVFMDGKICTYNDEVACSYPSKMDIEGAVVALPMVAILEKLTEDEVTVDTTEASVIIRGKAKRATIRMEKDIHLPIANIEKPGTWAKLGKGFNEALNLVQACAGKDDSQFLLTCVHIHPDYIEACDNEQVSRFNDKTGFTSELMVRRDSIKHIVALDMTHVSETKNWVHFKNPSNLILSCRRYNDAYPDMSPILQVSGSPLTLPKSIGEAVERCEVFSAESTDDNLLTVSLTKGKLRVKGEGAHGDFVESRKIKYEDEDLAFRIAPYLLVDLVDKHNQCEVTSNRLKITVGKLDYVTVLTVPKAPPAKKKKKAKKKTK
jgi:hypothetical protein